MMPVAQRRQAAFPRYGRVSGNRLADSQMTMCFPWLQGLGAGAHLEGDSAPGGSCRSLKLQHGVAVFRVAV